MHGPSRSHLGEEQRALLGAARLRFSFILAAQLLITIPANSAPPNNGLPPVRMAASRIGALSTYIATEPQTVAAPPDVAAPTADAQTTQSGIATKLLKPGRSDEHPVDNDCVKVIFVGWKRDGTLVANSGTENEPVTQCLSGVAPGLAEALKLMVIGEKRRIWVPARLSFTSDEPDEGKPKVDLTFDVELVGIIKAPPTPTDLKAPPKSATKLSSGVAVQVIKKGTGTEHPVTSSRVTLHFSGWATDGRLFETTVMGAHPAVFLVSEVIPGWREALLTMVVGEKLRLWVPADLAYGKATTRGHDRPPGDLVYEIELLAVE